MSRKSKALEVVDETPKESNLTKMKGIARAFNKHLNTQYQEAVSYVPDRETVAGVQVNKWLEMPESIQEALELPGLPVGNITHVYGKPNTGKTTFLMEGIAAAQAQDFLPILILTEHKFSFDRLENFMGVDPEAMLVLHADTLDQAYSFMEKILKDLRGNKLIFEDEETGHDTVIDMTDQDVFMFMDSIGNTLSKEELEYDIEDGDKSMGKHAKALKRLTKRINLLLGKKDLRNRAGILLLNQSYTSMPSYGPAVETPYGGDGVPYSCVLNIRLRRKKDISMTLNRKDVVIGLETLFEVKKNHITHLQTKSSVYTVASGMIRADKSELDDYRKFLRSETRKS